MSVSICDMSELVYKLSACVYRPVSLTERFVVYLNLDVMVAGCGIASWIRRACGDELHHAGFDRR